MALQLQNVEPFQARSSAWWYICHIAWLRQGVFPNPPDTAFKARVNTRILQSDPATVSSTASRTLDDATRNLLRRLGGLPHIRRLSRVAEDPPIPRAYWRHRLAAEASNSATRSSLTARECHRILHRSSWGRFIERTQNAYTSLLAPRALLAVCAIAQENNRGVQLAHLQVIAQRVLQAHPEFMDFDLLSRPPEPISPESSQPDAAVQLGNNRQERRRRRR